ncbi:MAG: hypothetical protein GXP49_02635 [Deltaproteobacteria bacterium]|nr:hypothetical protein [Deltaproteobacteria bacterium]
MSVPALKKATIRVSSAKASELIDHMATKLGLSKPAWLYKVLAVELGVHPGTVLRYHRRELRTLDVRRLKALEAFTSKVDRGEVVAPKSYKGSRHRFMPRGARVPTSLLKPLLERLLKKLGIKEKQIIYRSISSRTGLHENTLLQYFNEELDSAPASVESALRALLTECDRNGCPTLTRAQDGRQVVPRLFFCHQVDRVMESCGFENKIDLFKEASEKIGVSASKLSKAYYDNRTKFVPREYVDELEEVESLAEYDPARSYHLGQRLRHPSFGTGIVVEKLKKNIIKVRLDQGGELMLRENYYHDPYRCRRDYSSNESRTSDTTSAM